MYVLYNTVTHARHDLLAASRGGSGGTQQGISLSIGPGRYCSPRHRTPFTARNERSTCELMSWRAISVQDARERDASECRSRHQAFALAPVGDIRCPPPPQHPFLAASTPERLVMNMVVNSSATTGWMPTVSPYTVTSIVLIASDESCQKVSLIVREVITLG